MKFRLFYAKLQGPRTETATFRTIETANETAAWLRERGYLVLIEAVPS